MIFDPPLTSKGREQARALREKLRTELSVHGDALWVVSQLTKGFGLYAQLRPQGLSSHGVGSCCAAVGESPGAWCAQQRMCDG
jgi:hypothetical protein